MTLAEKAELIIRDIKKETGVSPVGIFKHIAGNDYINIHGPEHHVLDGASILVAYKNAGGELEEVKCEFSNRNEQCIHLRCPYFSA